MADVNDKDLSVALGQGEVKVEPEKIKVGEKEYTQEELNSLVSLGGIAKELEDKWHTKIDTVYPEYTKGQQKIKELEETKKKYDEIIVKQNKPAIPEDQQIAEARKILREQFHVVFEEDLPQKALTKEDFPTFYKQQREAEKLLDEADTMEEEIDGKDGRPAFKKLDVLQYMADNGIPNLKTAYSLMYETQLDAWKEQQLGKVKKGGITTMEGATAGGRKEPEQPKTAKNVEELAQQLHEELYGPNIEE
jgi:hypothetical protein